MRRTPIRHFAVSATVVLIACSGATTIPVVDSDLPVVLSVSPASHATGVSTSAPITVRFSHPMMVGMELLVTLHEGTITGPVVPGSFAWSSDRTSLTFSPIEPLKPGTTYVLHLSANLRDVTGSGIDFGTCAQGVGGQPVPPGTIPGGRMGGPNGAGMMGPGWQSGRGTWGNGMSFIFTTA